MNRILYLLLAMLLVMAQTLPLQAGGGKDEKALLWKISGRGLKKPSFLYGTIHAVCPDKMSIPIALQNSVSQTEQLSLELDMDAPEMMAQVMKHAKLPQGQSLKAMLTEEEYNLLLDYFSVNLGINLMYMDNMKPFILQTMLLPMLMECTPDSYEQKLMELAHSQKKEVVGIETVQEQMAAVDNVPNEVYVQMLVRTVKDIAKSKADYREMLALYLAQDLAGLQELMKRDYAAADYEKFNEVLLVQRNKNWIPVLERMAKDKPTLFAVGAAHLAGEHGVIALLRKQGYSVSPVTSQE